MDFQEYIESMKEYLKKDKCKVLNPSRIQEIAQSYKILKSIIDACDEETSINILEGALELGDICIRIVTPNFSTYDIKKLQTAILKATNVNIYPTTDDRIKIDIQFENAYFVSVL